MFFAFAETSWLTSGWVVLTLKRPSALWMALISRTNQQKKTCFGQLCGRHLLFRAIGSVLPLSNAICDNENDSECCTGRKMIAEVCSTSNGWQENIGAFFLQF